MFLSKRLLWIIGVVVVVVMLAAGVGLAYAFNALTQQKATNANLSATVTAQVVPSSSATMPANSGERRVVGVVQSLSSQAFTLEVTTKKAKRVLTVNVSAQTTYGHAGKAASFSDLQIGDTVVVLGTLDAQSLSIQATRVTISPKLPTPKASPTATATPAQ